MRILLIRHGDPDYSIDYLTPKGLVEAELLSRRLETMNLSKIYCSPLGRALATAAPTAEKLGLLPDVRPWMQEVPAQIASPADGKPMCPWHLSPENWAKDDRPLDRDAWLSYPPYAESKIPGISVRVREGIDELLAGHGFVRGAEPYLFDVEHNGNETIALFCHLGLGCLLLSHLIPVSAPILWHSFFLPTSSVTTLFMEERPEGKAIVRVVGMGDTSHLYAGDEPPSNSGLFHTVW